VTDDVDLPFARRIWLRIETIHAVTYFAPEAQAATESIGLQGFWRGYFACRAAPLGAVSAGTVEAIFANFEPSFVARRVPEVWSVVDPADALGARSTSAAEALRRLVPGVEQVALSVAPLLDRIIADADPGFGAGAGRPLFAANRAVPLPADPVAALWQRCTTLREHRGDGHVAALTAAGIAGLEAHVLITLDRRTDPREIQLARGWSEEQWAAAVDHLTARGMVSPDGGLTVAGRSLRGTVEDTTDRLAAAPYDGLRQDDRGELLAALSDPAREVSASGTIRYPNPMGLPPVV
jgi:hypothetical protein